MGFGRSWRLLSRHIPTNERAGPSGGRAAGEPRRAPVSLCVSRRALSAVGCGAAGRGRLSQRGRTPGGCAPASALAGERRTPQASPGPSPEETHRGLSVDPAPGVGRLLPPALGQAWPLAHLRALRVSALPPPASPRQDGESSSSPGDLKVSAGSPKSCHIM